MSKVWFITGAGSGIGRDTAKAALKAGDRVVASGRDLQKLQRAFEDVVTTISPSSSSTLRTRSRQKAQSMKPFRDLGASTLS